MADTTTLICPKCRGEMRTYERNSVQLDQCEECRGIFLDRGELEKLIDAATASVGPAHPGDSEREPSHEQHDGSRRRRRTSPSSMLSDFLGGGE